jgi:hypothetical protein
MPRHPALICKGILRQEDLPQGWEVDHVVYRTKAATAIIKRRQVEEINMPRMMAIEAAVHVLEKEGVTVSFGVPGAAINPLYSAMNRHGGIRHILARHVEGASHMADGYTRAMPGNIGVCIGTSGPAGTDMITGPLRRLRRQRPDPVHHRPGASRQAAQGGFPGDRH